MRNIYDQYEQPENRLTHALATTLTEDRNLIRPFLRWLGIKGVPPASKLQIVEQQVPGEEEYADETEARGLPDMCIFTDDGWAAVFECKVQAPVSIGQLQRHLNTVKRYGFEDPHLVVLAIEPCQAQHQQLATHRQWRELYAWLNHKHTNSPWATTMTEFMEVFESKMTERGYGIRGALTMFNGLRFDEDNPYTYQEGRRLIRLLGDELQGRRDLRQLKINPKGERRKAITGRGLEAVWDFIPLKAAKGTASFTNYPHLTMAIARNKATAALTVPNGVKGGFRTKLRKKGSEDFIDRLIQVEKNLRKLIRKSQGSQPLVYVTQRHYKTQNSPAIIDGRLQVDLRALSKHQSSVKYQPEWGDAICRLLANKRSNIQLGIEVQFSYECTRLRSVKAPDLFAEAWLGMRPMLEFALPK